MQEPNSYGAPAPNSTLAVVSLVAGILGLSVLPGIASVVALITGYMAQKEIRESGGRLGGEGMARIGIVLGWVAMALAVLVGCCFAIFFTLPFLGMAVQPTSWLTVFPALF